MPVTIQEAYRNPNRLDKNRYALDKERPFKPVMERKTYQNYARLLTRDHENKDILGRSHTDHKRKQMLAQTTIPTKTLITIYGKTKIFHDKTKFAQYLSTDPALQRTK